MIERMSPIFKILMVLFTFVLLLGFSDLRGYGKKKLNERNVPQIHDDHNSRTNRLSDYNFIPFPQLIGMAELVVIGEVTKVGDSTFTFHLEEDLLKNHSSNTLEVRKFIPSTIDEPRLLPYAVKQRYVLFLTQQKDGNYSQPWKILGLSGEGEMPIDNDNVFFKSFFLQGLENKQHQVHGINSTFQQFNLPAFIDAIQYYKHCFSWNLEEYTKNNKKRKRWIATKNCSGTTLADYQAKSWLHEYLVKETLKKIKE